MSLHTYRRKRQFDRTREPEPGRLLPKGGRAIFVVQLHHASRRHYDFRLQVGNALKSWAVPKGPSYDPAVKRMAVEVEDHPVDYASFEGEIPHGEYGGGHVAQFDHGLWTTDGDPEEQLAKGHLRFELFGEKLKGGWHLVRSGKPARQPQWLLFKDKDAYVGTLEADDLLADVTPAPAIDRKRAGTGKTVKKQRQTVAVRKARSKDWAAKALLLPDARKAQLPARPFEPQLAKVGEQPPEGKSWIHELKWDGYRILVTIMEGRVRLWSRNALEWTEEIPDIRHAIEALGLTSAALDGELIAGSGTRQDFNLLQGILSGERQGTLSLVVFDLLHVDGVDIASAPLVDRKVLLQQMLKKPPAHLAFSSHVTGEGKLAFELAGQRHFEGIISKRADRPYRAGRSDDWRKTKQLASDEFAVVGYTAPKGKRSGFGSLLLAKPDAVHGWRYAGRVGTGFDDELMREITRRLAKGGGSKPTAFVGEMETDLRTATWFAPRFVVEVFYRGMGRQRLLRQPSLKALRADKGVDDLTDSNQADMSKRGARTMGASEDVATPSSKPTETLARRQLPKLSSPTKILFPGDGITKHDVWNYYLAVADHLLPEVVGRPLSVIRCPAGIGRPCFFQKHMTSGLGLVSTVKLKEESGVQAHYLVVDDLPGLMELVQFNALEFHPWGAQADRPDRADRVVFDLDPGPGVSFTEVKKAAVDIRKLLEQLELTSFLRVSGGKGLHVVVPLNPGCDWDLTKRFAHSFADALAQSEPHRFLATATKARRNKRIFVDYLRNARGATAVSSYSVRSRQGAPVAMPIAWRELGKVTRADTFSIKEVPAKLKRRRKDPWEGITKLKQDLSRWAQED